MTLFINVCQPDLEPTGYKKCRLSYRIEIVSEEAIFMQLAKRRDNIIEPWF